MRSSMVMIVAWHRLVAVAAFLISIYGIKRYPGECDISNGMNRPAGLAASRKGARTRKFRQELQLVRAGSGGRKRGFRRPGGGPDNQRTRSCRPRVRVLARRRPPPGRG